MYGNKIMRTDHKEMFYGSVNLTELAQDKFP
jgi:hypothetical protein